MTRDGYMPRQFARTNARGVPVGSMLWDGAVIATLLLVFGTNVVNVVAAANVGYLVVFVLLGPAFVLLERHGGRTDGRRLRPLALTLAAFNGLLLFYGGAQWGAKVVLTGAIVLVLIVPISALRRLQDRRNGCTALLPFPAGEPHEQRIEVPAVAMPVDG
jgi:amino acid transporter